jgi:hypothetical protein
MKKALIFLMMSSTPLCWGQLQVKIGNDTTFCSENIEAIQIAPHLSVAGGTAPYKYSWSKSVPYECLPNRFYYASDLLNDTTLANPLLISQCIGDPNTWNQFVLTVEESEGNTAKDSINIRFSAYNAFPLDEYPVYITKGDSILFDITNDDFGGIRPYASYSWYPQEGLSDPNSSRTWCKPEKETRYSCLITDFIGCETHIWRGYWIIVTPTASISSVSEKNNIYRWKRTIYFDNPEKKEAKLSFYDSSGKLIYETTTKSNHYEYSFNERNSILFCTLRMNDKQQTIKYFVP